MPTDDQQRLEALKRFFVLDHAESEDEITRLVRVAAELYGVRYAVLTLRESAYDWEFIPVSGASFRDSGTGTCH